MDEPAATDHERAAPSPIDEDRAVEAQLDEVRERLLREGAAIGLAGSVVSEAVENAAEQYRSAPVRSFVGVLVERTVRRDLSIPPDRR